MARQTIPQRTRIFVAGEGESEIAFIAWLQDLCDQSSLHVHLDRPRRLRPGDPLTLVSSAIEDRRRSAEKAGIGHRASCLLIDTDRLEDGSTRSNEAIVLAQKHNLVLIRQRPCFEGVLVRLHRSGPFSGTANEAERRLRNEWRDYRKPPNRQQLAARFRLADLRCAAAADDSLQALLAIVDLA